MAKLSGVPEGGQLWKVGNTSYIIYDVEFDGEPKGYLAYRIPDQSSLRDITSDNIKYDRNISWDQWRKLGIVEGGFYEDLVGQVSHPKDRFFSQIKRQAKTQPWLLEDDILMLAYESYLEGRGGGITAEEIQRTDWWRGRNQEQRRWLITVASDPKTAQQQINTQRLNTAELLRQAGVSKASDAIIEYLSDRYVKGDISAAQLREEIKQVADPYYEGKINPTLADLISSESTIDRTHEGEDRIREIVLDWLGEPGLNGMSEEEIGRRAHDLREDPDFEQQFIEQMKDRKLALYPAYSREVSYEAMSAPWKNLVSQTWGTALHDNDPFLQNIIKRNDFEYAEQKLRQEGRRRGIANITDELTSSLFQQTGGAVRRAV